MSTKQTKIIPDIKVPINVISSLLPNLWKASQVPMLWGPPGVGKSQIVKTAAKEQEYTLPNHDILPRYSPFLAGFYGQTLKGRKLYDLRLVLNNPTDIKGIPVWDTKNGEARWVSTDALPCQPSRLTEIENRLVALFESLTTYGWKPNSLETPRDSLAWAGDNRGAVAELINEISRVEKQVAEALRDQFAVVFFDEISLAPKLVQGAALQIVLDRKAGTYTLPDGVNMCCAGNRVADRVGASVMTPALSNRLIHLHVADPEIKSWIEWARDIDIADEIIGFLTFKPDALMIYDPSQMTGSEDAPSQFATPRSWEKASELILKGDLLKLATTVGGREPAEAILGGTVGQATALVFFEWYSIYKLLPDANDVLDGRVTQVDYRKIAGDKDEALADLRAMSLKSAFVWMLYKSATRPFQQPALWEKDPAAFSRAVDRFYKFCEFMVSNPDDADVVYMMYRTWAKAGSSDSNLLGQVRKAIIAKHGQQSAYDRFVTMGNDTNSTAIIRPTKKK